MAQFFKKWNHITTTVLADLSKFGFSMEERLSKGKQNILEYGAGTGEASYRFALDFPNSNVVGVDIHNAFDSIFAEAQKNIGTHDAPKNLSYVDMSPVQSSIAIATAEPSMINRSILPESHFDFCFSWCVFEHIDMSIIEDTVLDIFKSLSPHGIFYLKINPLYFSVRGSHLHSILPEPWVHLKYDIATLRKKFFSAVYPNIPADEMWYQFETLNRISANHLRQILNSCKFNILHEDRKYEGNPPEYLIASYNEEVLRNKEVTFVCGK